MQDSKTRNLENRIALQEKMYNNKLNHCQLKFFGIMVPNSMNRKLTPPILHALRGSFFQGRITKPPTQQVVKDNY